MDKATVESVMALLNPCCVTFAKWKELGKRGRTAEEEDAALREMRDAQEAFRAEVERLAAQSAPTEPGGDVEPVAFMFQHSETGRVTFVDAWQKENGWAAANPRYSEVGALHGASTVATLKAERDAALARVAELEKDATRLEFVCNSPNRMVERESGLWRVYEDVAPTDHPTAVWQGMTPRWHVTPREAIDAAITAALTKGQP